MNEEQIHRACETCLGHARMKGFYIVPHVNPWIRIRETENDLGYIFWDKNEYRWTLSSLAGPRLMELHEELTELYDKLREKNMSRSCSNEGHVSLF